jgi:CRP-like cAMP-binding protein
MYEKILGPQEILFQEKDTDSCLYFCMSGDLSIFLQNSQKEKVYIEQI